MLLSHLSLTVLIPACLQHPELNAISTFGTSFLRKNRRETRGRQSPRVPCQGLCKVLVAPSLNRCWQITAVSFGLLLNKLHSPFPTVSSIFPGFVTCQISAKRSRWNLSPQGRRCSLTSLEILSPTQFSFWPLFIYKSNSTEIGFEELAFFFALVKNKAE